MPAPTSGPELARHVTNGSRRVGIAANFVGAFVLSFAMIIIGGAETEAQARRFNELMILFAVVIVVAIPTGAIVLTRAGRPLQRALIHGEPLVGDVRRRLLMAPWLNAIVSFAIWAAAAVVFATFTALRLDATLAEAASVGLNILLGALTTMAIVYLLIERVLRPAFALAFSHEPPTEVRGVAVGPRLLLAWMLGAGVPLLLIASVMLDSDNARADFSSVQMVALTFVGIGLLAGSVVTFRVARSVAEPLGSMREAMASVAAGELQTTVEVDDATEVGLLQAGFNNMVGGLRERERLRDLFGRHVGEDVARNAIDRGVELGGEVREASAVFIDLIGSTALTAARSPSEVVEMLNAFFAAVVRAAEAHGGWVNKFEGDAALFVFGVPVAAPDHAARSLRAARALRDELAAVRARYPEIDAGIGASTGQVLAGNVGAKHRYEYTVIGDPVNEAARLTDEAKNRDGRVLASEAAIRASGQEATCWREVGPMQLRGRPEATVVYEPV